MHMIYHDVQLDGCEGSDHFLPGDGDVGGDGNGERVFASKVFNRPPTAAPAI